MKYRYVFIEGQRDDRCLLLTLLHACFLSTLGIFLLTRALSVSAAGGTLLDRAKEHLANGQPAQAYELLLPLQSDRAGEVDFDYLLGIAALESNQPAEALFPLERVLAVQVDYPGARIAIARAYAKLGDRETARREFDLAAKAGGVPPQEEAKFRKDLERRSDSGTRVNGFISLSLGYDDNVNSTNTSSSVDTPSGTILLDDTRLGVEDGFGKLRAGIQLTHPVSNNLSVLAKASAFGRFNESADDEDFSAIDGQIGLRWKQDKNTTLTGSMFGSQFNRDYDHYRDSYGLILQLRHRLNRSSNLSGFIRATRLDYRAQSNRDAKQFLAGGSYIRAFGENRSSIGYVSVFGGTSDPDDDSRDDYGYNLMGLRIGAEFGLTPVLRPYVSGGYSYRKFDDNHRIFLKTRKDDRYQVRLGLRYVPVKKWTIKPEVSYANNDSNIVLNEYERTLFSVTVRRDFN